MKVAVFYYMRLEDKYWVLFFAALVLLCAMHEYGKLSDVYGGRLRRIAGYGLVSYILLFSSIVYDIVASKFPWFQSYYELTHAVMMTVIIAIATTAAALQIHEKEKKKLAVLAAGLVVVLCFAGDFAYFPSAGQDWNYDVSKEEKQIYEMMLSHADSRGVKEVTFWGMDELMFKSVFYDESLSPVYRKDILAGNAAYGEGAFQMYEGYRKYAEKKYNAERLREFSYALAGLQEIYPEVECEYIIVYRPEVRTEEPEKAEASEDAAIFDTEQMTDIFAEYQYVQVGRTGNRVVYFKGKAE